MLKSRFRNNKKIDYPKQDFYVFGENAPVLIHSDNMLNELNNMPIEIHSVDTIPTNCGFPGNEIVAAQNRKSSDTGGRPNYLELKLESKVALRANPHVQGELINKKIGFVKHFEINDNKISTIYVTFNDPNANKKLVTTNNIDKITNFFWKIKYDKSNRHSFHSDRREYVQCTRCKGLVCHKQLLF